MPLGCRVCVSCVCALTVGPAFAVIAWLIPCIACIRFAFNAKCHTSITLGKPCLLVLARMLYTYEWGASHVQAVQDGCCRPRGACFWGHVFNIRSPALMTA